MSAAHTPTPWSVFRAGKQYGIDAESMQSIVSFGDDHEPDIGVQGATIEEAHANAEFIVRAVNSHEDLVAALKEARGYLELYAGTGFDFSAIDAALQKSTGDPR